MFLLFALSFERLGFVAQEILNLREFEGVLGPRGALSGRVAVGCRYLWR